MRRSLPGSPPIVGAALCVVILALALRADPALLTRFTREARSVTEPGSAPLRALDGAAVRLVPEDSVTALLVVQAECPACRAGTPSYHEFVAAAREAGVAVRVVILSRAFPAAQYARRLPRSVPVLSDTSGRVADALGVSAVPSLYVFGRGGVLAERRSPFRYDPETRARLETRYQELRAGP